MIKKIIIFGCGFHGRAVFRNCIKKKKQYNVICWIDNNIKKENKKLFKKNIYNPKKLNKLKYDYIIFSGRNIKYQLKQIQKITKKKNFIFWGNKKIKPSNSNIKKRDDKLKIILKDLLGKLEKNNIPYWVDFSSLLTLHRKEDLSIRSDFDISMDISDAEKIFKLFKTNSMYSVIKSKKNNIKKIFFRSKNNVLDFEPALVDIVFKIFSKKSPYVYNYGNLKKKFPIKYFNGYDQFRFLEFNVRTPKQPLKYLNYLYGNWKKKVEFYDNPLANKIKY